MTTTSKLGVDCHNCGKAFESVIPVADNEFADFARENDLRLTHEHCPHCNHVSSYHADEYFYGH